MKTSVSLPDSLVQAADEVAARLDVTRGVLIRRALERLLSDSDDGQVTEAANKLHGRGDSRLMQAAAPERPNRLAETDHYLARLTAEVGSPSDRTRKRAEATAARLERRPASKGG